jgi:hypothetical protein
MSDDDYRKTIRDGISAHFARLGFRLTVLLTVISNARVEFVCRGETPKGFGTWEGHHDHHGVDVYNGHYFGTGEEECRASIEDYIARSHAMRRANHAG